MNNGYKYYCHVFGQYPILSSSMGNHMEISHLPKGSVKAVLCPHIFFIICAEAMSSLIHKEARKGRITGVPVFRGCTSIHHLFFPDDNLLFCRVITHEWGRIKVLLVRYEEASGQKIN